MKYSDPIFDEVVEEIIKCERVSIPFLQRRFAIGYTRAERLLTQLVQFGYVEKAKNYTPRKVIKNKLLQ